jgi:GNAT superfamily N-acetyltransferase
VKVVYWDSRYHNDFVRLNEAWIEKHFGLEETDRKYLRDPQGTIIDKGGEIVFLIDGDCVVGTCALVRQDERVYELAKMAVDERMRGRGLGNRLMEAVLDCAHEKGACKVFLLSNIMLTPAISLYKKYGFRTVRLGPHPDYDRANIEMEIDLTDHRG